MSPMCDGVDFSGPVNSDHHLRFPDPTFSGTNMGKYIKSLTGWWFGCHEFYFPIHIGFLIIPIDFHIFQRGSNHQPASHWCLQFLFRRGTWATWWYLENRPRARTSHVFSRRMTITWRNMPFAPRFLYQIDVQWLSLHSSTAQNINWRMSFQYWSVHARECRKNEQQNVHDISVHLNYCRFLRNMGCWFSPRNAACRAMGSDPVPTSKLRAGLHPPSWIHGIQYHHWMIWDHVAYITQ